MRATILVLASLVPAAAAAHPGHLASSGDHAHLLGLAMIAVAVAVGADDAIRRRRAARRRAAAA